MSQRDLAKAFSLGRNTITAILNMVDEAGTDAPRTLTVVGGDRR